MANTSSLDWLEMFWENGSASVKADPITGEKSLVVDGLNQDRPQTPSQFSSSGNYGVEPRADSKSLNPIIEEALFDSDSSSSPGITPTEETSEDLSIDTNLSPVSITTFLPDVGTEEAINGVLHKNGIHWNRDGNVGNRNDWGDGVTITYSFMEEVPSYYSFNPDTGVIQFSAEATDFREFTSEEKNYTRQALENYRAVANINFVEVSDAGDGGTVRFGRADRSGSNGWAFRPSSSPKGGDVWLDNGRTDLAPGQKGYQTLVHELGHAIGGFNDVTIGYNQDGRYSQSLIERNKGVDGATLSPSQDSYQYTVMSYRGHPDMPGVLPRTLMLYDIAAVQTLYGANWNHNSGNTTYSWNTNETFLETIWDGGGIDKFDASNQTLSTKIDLRAGEFSSIGSYHGWRNATNNVAIAFGVTIENAEGGKGHDTIRGNSARNVLQGNSGNDRIYGGEENDIIKGDAGNDYLYGENGNDRLYGGNDNDRLYGSSGNDYLYGESGNDRLYGGNDNDRLYGGSGNNYLLGNHGDDRLYGGSDDDRLYGGNDDDRLYGSSGEDYLYGDSGNDRLYGGNHDDKLYGGSGDDQLSGGYGNDILNGYQRGSSQIDTLTGGGGDDTFVLGGSWGVSYLREGYAVLKDWNHTRDSIEVAGSARDYSFGLGHWGGSSALDIGLFYQNNAIAVIHDSTSFNINIEELDFV